MPNQGTHLKGGGVKEGQNGEEWRERQRDRVRERVQTQWNTPEPDPKAEHQKDMAKHPAINTP